MKVFFISDLHFNHEGMARLREFLDAKQMNEVIISQWNSVVTNKIKV